MSTTSAASSTRSARVDQVRRQTPVLGDRRVADQGERDRLLTELDRLDDEIAALSRRRAALGERLAELRERLWPAVQYRRGRRPGAAGDAALPPLPPNPIWLYGRRLRSVCLALLRRSGRLALPQLHALLHAHGYGIDSAHAAKTLSDALSYEVEHGRAARVRRGEYEVAGPQPRPGRHGAPAVSPPAPVASDRLLDEVLSPAPCPAGAR